MKPCSECSKSSDNRYSNCPPKMSDGRMFTDYRPRCLTNFAVSHIEGNFDLPNSYEYRQYLVANASTLMAKDRQMAYKNNYCGPCVEPYNEGTMLPEKNTVKCDASKCSFYANDPNGLGTGRQYQTVESSRPKEAFLELKKKEQMGENCCWAPIDDKQYFSYDGTQGPNGRVQVPSGAMPFTGINRGASIIEGFAGTRTATASARPQ